MDWGTDSTGRRFGGGHLGIRRLTTVAQARNASMRKDKDGTRIELWGGMECTVNRVGDRHFDQFAKSGHLERIEDLDLVAELGIRTLRYPVLWERTAPDDPRVQDWSFSDAGLERLRGLEIKPIVGLTHHGSGPKYTDLLDDGFAAGLADHARATAERYPWIEAYTPVNEPLTTARFSAMYGHWYPHATDARSFARALVNQVKAVVLSMEAIRSVNPDAHLVQTEDLGKTHSTERMRYQADYENERRWITWDLLLGRVDQEHPMWRELVQDGVDERELDWFLEHSCPPDVVGVNYYLTSERFLDHQPERYPADKHGANAFDPYADVEAVRVLAGDIDGPAALMRETWERYGLPLAITECHLGCTREEQVRWLLHVWRQAEGAKAAGVDVRAVTVWSMFGAYDWGSLLTQDDGKYEPGVFDLRAPEPRLTALATAVRALGEGEIPSHPAFEDDGWWDRPVRLLYEPRVVAGGTAAAEKGRAHPRVPLLIVDDGGQLATAFRKLCKLRGLEHRMIGREETHEGWAVVDVLGQGRALPGVPRVTFSNASDLDGKEGVPYVESEAPLPDGGLVVRTGELFGPWGRGDDFLQRVVDALREGRRFEAAENIFVSPTFVPDLVHAVLDLMLDGMTGLVHLSHGEAVSLADLARRTARLTELDADLIGGTFHAEPTNYALTSERVWTMPPLDDALEWYSHELRRSFPARIDGGYLI